MKDQPTRRASCSVLLESNSNGEVANMNMGVRLVPRRYSNEWEPPSLGSSDRESFNSDDNSNNRRMGPDEATKRILHRDMFFFVLTMTVTISILVLSKMQQSPYQYASAAFRALTQGASISISSDDILSSMSTCQPMSVQEEAEMHSWVTSQEHSASFHLQLSEARGATPLETQHAGILTYLTNHVLRPQWSILDFGCGAGTVLSEIQRYYERTNPAFGAAADFDPLFSGQAFVGVEVVGGFVNQMADEMKIRGIDIYQGE